MAVWGLVAAERGQAVTLSEIDDTIALMRAAGRRMIPVDLDE